MQRGKILHFLLMIFCGTHILSKPDIVFERDMEINATFWRSISGIGPNSCLEECKANRAHCGSVSYNTKHFVCSLYLWEDIDDGVTTGGSDRTTVSNVIHTVNVLANFVLSNFVGIYQIPMLKS